MHTVPGLSDSVCESYTVGACGALLRARLMYVQFEGVVAWLCSLRWLLQVRFLHMMAIDVLLRAHGPSCCACLHSIALCAVVCWGPSDVLHHHAVRPLCIRECSMRMKSYTDGVDACCEQHCGSVCLRVAIRALVPVSVGKVSWGSAVDVAGLFDALVYSAPPSNSFSFVPPEPLSAHVTSSSRKGLLDCAACKYCICLHVLCLHV